VTFNILSVRTAQDSDGRLYPVLGDASCPVELEQWDGNVQTCGASRLILSEWIKGGFKPVTKLLDVPIQLLTTDSRVVIACEKWNKGDRYWGVGLGATSALISNTVNKAKEARQRRGTMLLGHIRYGWLTQIGYGRTTGLGARPTIRLGVSHRVQPDNHVRALFLELALDKRSNSAQLAESIARRAAIYRLKYDADVTDEDSVVYRKYASGPPPLPTPQAKQYAIYKFPRSAPATEGTALPQSNGSVSDG
jgi:hypothetical protein